MTITITSDNTINARISYVFYDDMTMTIASDMPPLLS